MAATVTGTGGFYRISGTIAEVLAEIEAQHKATYWGAGDITLYVSTLTNDFAVYHDYLKHEFMVVMYK